MADKEIRTLDKILEQAFTDGASDTMWQNDRHVEIFATAKKEIEALISSQIVAELERLLSHQEDVSVVWQEGKVAGFRRGQAVLAPVIKDRIAHWKGESNKEAGK